MKLKVSYLFFISIIALACNEEDPEPTGEFDNGILVSNEGNFGEGNGSISFISAAGEESFDLFSEKNDGAPLGDVVQSIYHADGKFFITINNSNKIEVVDDENFESLYTIADVSLPRYMTHNDQTGYVAEWVSFAEEGRITAFNLNNGEILFRVTASFGAERPFVVGENLFVTNNFSNTVSEINLSDQSLVQNITVGSAPSFITEKDDELWVTCSGGFDSDFNPLNDGQLVKIDLSSKDVTVVSEYGKNISAKASYDPAREMLYTLSGSTVYKTDLNNPPSTPEVLFEADVVTAPYGIGVSQNQHIYITDSRGFQGNGQIFEFSNDGEVIATYDAGIGPNGFLFVK